MNYTFTFNETLEKGLELSDLLVFQTVAEEGGISAAAAKLHRVPSNITARIQKLEMEVGTPLFVREKNRLSISRSGTRLLDYSRRILMLADEAVKELANSEPSGPLSVASMESVAAAHLAPWLSRYHQNYPDVELTVKSGATGVLIDAITCGEIDLAFVADPPEDSRLRSLPLVRETLVLVSHKQQKTIRHPDQLGNSPTLLGFNPKCAYRKRLESWLKQSVNTWQVTEISSYHTLLSCAAAGMGIGLVTQSVLATFPDADSLKIHKLPKRWSQTTTCMIARQDNQTSAVKAFFDLLTSPH